MTKITNIDYYFMKHFLFIRKNKIDIYENAIYFHKKNQNFR